MQDPQPRRVSKFLSFVGLATIGVLLCGATVALADSYLRPFKKGVIYYYFPSNKPTSSHQVVMRTPPSPAVLPKTQTRAIILETGHAENLWRWVIKSLSRKEFAHRPTTISANSPPEQTPLKLDVVPDLPSEAFSGNMYVASRYLGGLWTMLSSLTRLTPAKHKSEHQQMPPIDEARAKVREACDNFLLYAQERLVAGCQKGPKSIRFQEPNPLGYCFPVAYPFSFRDSWGDPRNGGRQHRAVDIFAREGTEVYATTPGVIDTLATFPEAGITLILRGQDGKGYGYMHLQGYAEGIVAGKTVKSGELLGYVGRTGVKDSEAHLHFQVYADHRMCKDELLNPYNFLVQLCHGQGVTDLYDHKVARIHESPAIPVTPIQVTPIQVTRRPTLKVRSGQIRVKEPSILVIKNF